MDNKHKIFPVIRSTDNWPTAFAKVQFILNLTYKDQDIIVVKEHVETPLENLIRNKDYFLNEGSLKEYVHREYGWTGTIEDPFITTDTLLQANSVVGSQQEGRNSAMQQNSPPSAIIRNDDDISIVLPTFRNDQQTNQLDNSTHGNTAAPFCCTTMDISKESNFTSQDRQDLNIKRNLNFEKDWATDEHACHWETTGEYACRKEHLSCMDNDAEKMHSREMSRFYEESEDNECDDNNESVDDYESVDANESASYNEREEWQLRATTFQHEVPEDSVDDESNTNEEQNLSIHERLLMCLKDMHTGSSNPSIFHDEVEKLDEILTLLQDSLHDLKSSFIFISGPPGTGKTLIVQRCIAKCEEIYIGLKHCSLQGSCFSENEEEIYQRIASMIDNRSRYTTVQQLSRKLGTSTKVNRLPYVVIFDEIDFLVSSAGKKSTKGFRCVQTLVKWASDLSKRLILICISNSVGDDIAKRITSLSKHCKHVIFRPYTAEDLESIVMKRLGINQFLFRPGVIKYASKKIANESGDARQIIHTFHTVLDNVLETMNESELFKPCPVSEEYQIINTIEVHQALNVTLNIGTSQLTEIISGLPPHAQILLAVLCTFGEALNNWMMIPVDDLMKYCFEAEKEGLFFSFSSRHFWELIELLENSGLISPSDLHNFYHDNEDMRFIKVGRNRFEISSVLKEITSEYRTFFDRMASYVKANPSLYEEMIEGDY